MLPLTAQDLQMDDYKNSAVQLIFDLDCDLLDSLWQPENHTVSEFHNQDWLEASLLLTFRRKNVSAFN